MKINIVGKREKLLKVAVDGRAIFNGEGVGQYALNLVKALSVKQEYEKYIFLNRTDPKQIIPKSFSKKINLACNYRHYYGNFYLPWEINKERIDIYHLPHNYSLPFKAKCKKILTLHDIIPYLVDEERDNREFPDKSDYLRIIQKNVQNADKILVDSQCSKDDVLQYLNVEEDNIQVVYPPVSEIFRIIEKDEISKIRARFNLDKNYILYTGRFTYRKNVERLAASFLASNFLGDLVLVGKINPLAQAIKEKYIHPRIKFLNFVTEKELVSLYNGAEMLIFPSLYEGFGYPIIEAFACGCPVITSSVGMVRELPREAVCLIDPLNVGDLKEKIESLAKNNVVRNKMREEGLKCLKKFSFVKFQDTIYKVYEELGKTD